MGGTVLFGILVKKGIEVGRVPDMDVYEFTSS